MLFLVDGLLFRKVFVILEQNSKQLSIFPNEAKQRIHEINILRTDFVMA